MLVIDQSQNGAAAEVAAGDAFQIQLSENPTTGYRWYQTSPGDGSFRVVEDTFELSQGGLGGGGLRHWTFVADNPAVVMLRFERKRGWQTQSVETFAVTIDVKPQ